MPNEALALRDIHLPAGIAWWPPAPGWWVLAAIIVILLTVAYAFYRRKQRLQLRESSLEGLAQIQEDYQQHQDAKKFVESLSILLRRISLSHYPRVDVAGLTGSQWLEFLDKGLDDSSQLRFSQHVGQSLITAPYQQHAEIDVEALQSLCKDWIMALPLNDVRGVGAE